MFLKIQTSDNSRRARHDAPEVSIVIPCLNESDTLAVCINKAKRGLAEHNIDGEIIVADNGSTDGSQQIAIELGARVIPIDKRGYGNALQGGIAAARGRFIVMADADDSYDFTEAPKFVHKLREGHDLVMGCRLPSGGGTVLPGAMPITHRYIGNPMFSKLAQWWFGVPTHDVYCGMRGFSREWVRKLNVTSPGMEFATEMILKAAFSGAKISEVPITLHPDGRKSHPPHLKTVRDGWRTLRFYLMSCPAWLFLRPGMILLMFGLLGYALALPGVQIAGVNIAINTLVFASAAMICGIQCMLLAVLASSLSKRAKCLVPAGRRLRGLLSRFSVEHALLASVFCIALGAALLTAIVVQWYNTSFGNLDYEHTLRWVIPGATLMAIGVQCIFFSFALGMAQMLRSEPGDRDALEAEETAARGTPVVAA